jgi:hypothetical protein
MSNNNFNEILSTIRNLDIYSYLNSQDTPSWEDFTSNILLSMNVITAYRSLLDYFENSFLFNTRDLLMIYPFIYYGMTEDNHDLLECCTEIQHIIHFQDSNNENLSSDLFEALEKYENIYIPWKTNDKSVILEKLSNMYWEYELNYKLYYDSLNDEDKGYFTEEKSKKQSECLETMKKIDNLNHFSKFQPVFMDTKMSEILIDVLRKAFWDKIIENLTLDPPSYESLIVVFDELMENIKVVHNNRPEIIEKYEDIIDTEYFIDTQNKKPFNVNFWKPRIYQLSELLIESDSLSSKEYHYDFFRNLEETFMKATNNKEHIELFVNGIAYICTRFMEIHDLYEKILHK